MHLEIITPEFKIFKGEVDAVQLPGMDGLFQILKGHAPIISGLSKGVIKIDLIEPYGKTPAGQQGGEKFNDIVELDSSNVNVIHIPIKGGVMELLQDKIIVLAE